MLFDGVMHADMHPFAPLIANNPLLGTLPLSVLHLGLVGAGVLGLAVLAYQNEAVPQEAD